MTDISGEHVGLQGVQKCQAAGDHGTGAQAEKAKGGNGPSDGDGQDPIPVQELEIVIGEETEKSEGGIIDPLV